MTIERALARYRQRLEGMREETPDDADERGNEETVERSAKRGRKKVTGKGGMADCVARGHDTAGVLAQLHRAIDGRSGVEVPRILRVAQLLGLLRKVPSWEVAQREFGDIGARSGYYKAKNEPLTEGERTSFGRLFDTPTDSKLLCIPE